MSELWVRRVSHALVPDGTESLRELERLPQRQSMHCVIRRPRNLQHHRLYWVLVNKIAAGIGADPQNVSDVVKLATGHCVTVRTKSFGLVHFPRSIAFSAMDQDAFGAFFERFLEVAHREWGIPAEELEQSRQEAKSVLGSHTCDRRLTP